MSMVLGPNTSEFSKKWSSTLFHSFWSRCNLMDGYWNPAWFMVTYGRKTLRQTLKQVRSMFSVLSTPAKDHRPEPRHLQHNSAINLPESPGMIQSTVAKLEASRWAGSFWFLGSLRAQRVWTSSCSLWLVYCSLLSASIYLRLHDINRCFVILV